MFSLISECSSCMPPAQLRVMTSNDTVRLTTDVLSVEEATSLVSDASVGATSVFIGLSGGTVVLPMIANTFSGTTRDNFEGKKVLQLEYEAYEPQALSEMKKICATIRGKWTVHGISMLHRTGSVK